MPRGRPPSLSAGLSDRLVQLHRAYGLGAREIAEALERAGVDPPASGGRWHPSTVSRCLARRGIALSPGRPQRWLSQPRPWASTPLHTITAIAWRRRAAGSGSDLWALLEERIVMDDLAELDSSFGSVPRAVVGAVAANRFMPPRQTGDVDFAICDRDEAAAGAALEAAGWHRMRRLLVRPPMSGIAWQAASGAPVDVLTVPGVWGRELVETAMANREGGPPFATLPHLVVLKMIAGRTVDGGDVARMLGHQDALTLEAVRLVARRVLGPEELADLDQLIELGRLEYGARPGGPG
jgi:hypothetical protein